MAIDRICISINNKCNLSCKYCHFHEKDGIVISEMDVFKILDNVKHYAKEHFKIGFVGNGECFLDWEKLKNYISYLENYENISIYTITNGTIALSEEDWRFLEEHRVNVGFSIDGYKELHDMNRCGSFGMAIKNVEAYNSATGHYPTFNATVGADSLENADKIISFFKKYGTKVTFSRMIGKYGITLQEYREFLKYAEKEIPIRRGGFDCTMYGGRCGAGKNNYFFANGKVYYCGNCVNLPPIGDSDMPFEELEKISLQFDRNLCYKESL